MHLGVLELKFEAWCFSAKEFSKEFLKLKTFGERCNVFCRVTHNVYDQPSPRVSSSVFLWCYSLIGCMLELFVDVV